MVNVRSPRCLDDSCSKQPSYNFEGCKPAACCKDHAEDDMVNVRGSRFSHASCKKEPKYNFEGSKPATYCEGFAGVGMVGVCGKRSSIKSRSFCGDARREPTDGVPTACSLVKVEMGLGQSSGE